MSCTTTLERTTNLYCSDHGRTKKHYYCLFRFVCFCKNGNSFKNEIIIHVQGPISFLTPVKKSQTEHVEGVTVKVIGGFRNKETQPFTLINFILFFISINLSPKRDLCVQ
jgi:hypothetical protein